MAKRKLVPGPPVGCATARPIVRLWREARRAEQKARLGGLRLQTCDDAGKAAWEAASAIHKKFPSGVRIDLPSWRVFARVLGLYRSGSTLSSRPMELLELSVTDIAGLVGYSKSVVEAALRWLGSEPITYFGMQLTHGLRFIDRTRRKAKAFVAGVFREVYRTSRTRLTALGEALVGITRASYQVPRDRRTRRCGKRPSGGVPAAPVDESPPDWEANIRGLRSVLMMV